MSEPSGWRPGLPEAGVPTCYVCGGAMPAQDMFLPELAWLWPQFCSKPCAEKDGWIGPGERA